LRVLLVEDDPESSECVGELLRFWGHEGRLAETGGAAFAAAAEFRPQAAIVDFQLPDMNGAEVARRLRADFGSDLLLIAFTGFSDPAHREQARASGFDDFMVKPVDFKALRERLGRFAAGG
jgi:DNA-binding response OmpR family regulator